MFWLIVSALCLVAITLTVFPLLRRGSNDRPEQDALNAAVLASQRSELDQDLTDGVIDEEQYRQAQAELLREAREVRPKSTMQGRSGCPLFMAGVVAVAIPLLAIAVYKQVGTEVGSVPSHAPQAAMEMPDVAEMVARLERRLESNPNDPAGWSMLVRSYLATDRGDDAQKALLKAFNKGVANAELYVQYADLLASQQESLAGEPIQFINKALALDPDHLQALWLAGSAALESDPKSTIKYWERLHGLLEPGSDDAQFVSDNLHAVRAELASKGR